MSRGQKEYVWAFTDDDGTDLEVRHDKGSGVISICEPAGPLDDHGQEIVINAIDAPKIITALQAALQLAAESGVYRHNDA